MGFKNLVAADGAFGIEAHHKLQVSAEAFVVAGRDGGTDHLAGLVEGHIACGAVDGAFFEAVEGRKHGADSLFDFCLLGLGHWLGSDGVESCQGGGGHKGDGRQCEQHILE